MDGAVKAGGGDDVTSRVGARHSAGVPAHRVRVPRHEEGPKAPQPFLQLL